MPEYISREAAIARMTALEVTNPSTTLTDARRTLADMPAADVAPVVHAKWIPFHSQAAGDIQYCSACDVGFDAPMGFCPHCGARMDGKAK